MIFIDQEPQPAKTNFTDLQQIQSIIPKFETRLLGTLLRQSWPICNQSPVMHFESKKSFVMTASLMIKQVALKMMIILRYDFHKNGTSTAIKCHLEIKHNIYADEVWVKDCPESIHEIQLLQTEFKNLCSISISEESELTFKFQEVLMEGMLPVLVNQLKKELKDFQKDLLSLSQSNHNLARLIFQSSSVQESTQFFRKLRLYLKMKPFQIIQRDLHINFHGVQVVLGQKINSSSNQNQTSKIREKKSISTLDLSVNYNQIHERIKEQDNREKDNYSFFPNTSRAQTKRSIYQTLNAMKIRQCLYHQRNLIKDTSFSKISKGEFVVSINATTIASSKLGYLQSLHQQHSIYLDYEILVLAAKQIIDLSEATTLKSNNKNSKRLKSILDSKKNEMNFLKTIAYKNHSHLLTYYYDEAENKQYDQKTLYSQWSDQGDLNQYFTKIQESKILKPSPNYLLRILKDLLKPLLFLKKCKLIHRDVKLGNYLWLKNKIKLIDFGSAFYSSSCSQQDQLYKLERSLKTTYSLCISHVLAFIKFKDTEKSMEASQEKDKWEDFAQLMPFSRDQALKIIYSYQQNLNAYDQHPNFDVSSFGFVVLRLVSVFRHIYVHESWIQAQLHFLAKCCLNLEPKNRPTLEDAFLYLREMIKMERTFF